LKISFYVSDHGYGHATRSIALARALAAAGGPGLELEVLNHFALGLLRRSLGGLPGVSVIDRPTDVGFVCREDRLAFDLGRTALRVSSWVSGWKSFVSAETRRLGQAPPDMILSDVAPEPLLVAEKLGVPSAIASNFTWVDQYEPHLRADLIAPLRGAYALASRAYVYPMKTSLAGVKNPVPTGLVTREPRRDRDGVRRALGAADGERLVHLGFGWTPDAASHAAWIDVSWLPASVRLLVSSNVAPLITRKDPSRPVALIPAEETEAHEAIAACDLVIAKAGYSTVAEAIAGGVPILAIPVEGSPESETIARIVDTLGIGISKSAEGLGDGRVFAAAADMLDGLDRYRDAYRNLPPEYAPGAAARLAGTILSHAGRRV
jgi:hypothetical protein